MKDRIGTTGVWFFTERMAAPKAVEFARRVEELGYGTLWLPETAGRDPFAHAAHLAGATERLVFATGIASIHHRHPGAMKQAANTVSEQSDGRFVLGLGVSHAPFVTGLRGLAYDKPLSAMREYLEKMRDAPYFAVAPAEPPPVLLAALGPKMLELSRTHADGAHPYLTTPEHTATAREILGSDKLLCVEQKVVLTTDAETARSRARGALRTYLGLPNYFKNWFRLGYDESDLADGGSDRLVDALVAWGDADTIRARITAHHDAGADHVCIQPIGTEMGVPDDEALEALAPS